MAIDSSDNIQFEYKGLGKALSEGRLRVPLNQREYAWEAEHVNDLYNDLANAISQGKPTYFLGTIVLARAASDIPEVADGQQRLSTAMILLAAIRDHHHRESDEILTNAIEQDFLFTIDRKDRSLEPRLTLNVDDNQFFKDYILEKSSSSARKELIQKIRNKEITKISHQKIAAAAQLASTRIKTILAPHSSGHYRNILEQWTAFVENCATVILLTVPSHMNAFVMFETLNDRGLRTSQADLIKNFLFGEVGEEQIQEAQHKWSSMASVLEALGDSETVMTYLRHLTITLEGHTTERQTFDKIQKRASGSHSALNFLDAIAQRAIEYVALHTPTHQKWNAFSASVRKHLEVLLQVRVGILPPLMLAVVSHFSTNEISRTLKMFVCWSVRFLIVGGARSAKVEEPLAELARRVTLGEIKNSGELAKEARDIVPSDARFKSAFANATVSKHSLARYYLRSLERYVKEDPEPELIPNEETVITLEHILPQNPPWDNWPNIEQELAAAIHKRIGNMALLKATPNSTLGDASFEEKKREYSKSAYILTKRVVENEDWGFDQITERQGQLSEIAVKTWPFGSPSR